MGIKTFLYGTVGLTVLVLSLLYGGAGRWSGILGAVISGYLFVLAQQYGLAWLSTVGLFGFVGLGMTGIWLELQGTGLLIAIALALAAWNLAYFAARLRFLTRAQVSQSVVRRYLVRLSGVTSAGFIAGLAALFVETNLGFAGALLVGTGIIAGLAVTIRFLIRQNEQREVKI